MLNGDLYPKGKKLFHTSLLVQVEYVCYAGKGIHIVLAPPLDFLDDGIREVKAHELADETVPDEVGNADCMRWIKDNQAILYKRYQKLLTEHSRECVDPEGGFLFYAIFVYEGRRLKAQMAPGSKTRQ